MNFKISDFVSFTLESGFAATLFNFDKAKSEFDSLGRSATLYGNRADGSRAVLFSK